MPSNVDRIVMAFAGFVILLSVLLGMTVSSWFFALTVFVGANLLQASFTGFCPLATMLKKLGARPGCAFQ